MNPEKCNVTVSCYHKAEIIKEQLVSHRSVHFFLKCGKSGEKGNF
jgi:hypothetical protein